MSELTLRQLEYFSAIVETRSITGAADACHVTQAAVSLALTQLERALGASLVIRAPGKKIGLTAEGQELALRAKTVLADVRDLSDAVQRKHHELSGRLVVGVFRTLAEHVIPVLVDHFTKHHPGVELDFVEGSGSFVQEQLLGGAVDCAVIYEAQLNPLCAGDMLLSSRRSIVVGAEHPLWDRASIRLAELTDHDAMLLFEEPAYQRTIAEFTRVGVRPRVRWRSTNVATILNVVGRGLAYSMLMQHREHSPEGRRLRFIDLEDDLGTNGVMFCVPQGVRDSALVREVRRCLATFWKEGAAG